MLSTAEQLNKLTEAGHFEALGSAFLREKFPHLSILIDTGRNEKGETIKGKVDGFTEYAKNKFAHVQYTINDSNLDYKWFSENEKKLGDLPKTLREINAIREIRPTATFEVYLVTHQPISDELAKKVANFASQEYLSIVIAENSTISHFLDNTGHGQYLRYKYLGIRQELISKELLRDMATDNIERYRLESSINNDFLAQLQDREKLILDIYNEPNPFCLLLGDSGLGKSTALYTCMTTLSSQGVLCLRIQPEIAIASHSLPGALIQQLQSDYSGLYVTDTLLSQLVDKKVMIVVDDVNRCPSPRSVITHLRFWSRTPASFPFKIICPVWPKHWEMDPSDKEGPDSIRTIPTVDANDATKVVEKYAAALPISLSNSTKRSIVKELGGDLLLIGLYCNGLSTAASFRANMGKSIYLLNLFLDATINQLSKRHTIPVYSLAKSLATFGKIMLVQRTLNPHYDDIQRWFKTDTNVPNHLNLLQADQTFFHFDASGNIIYRHDRIRDTILAKGFQLLLENIDEYREIVADPYFAEIAAITAATASLTQADCDVLMSMNPLSVFTALKFAQDPASSSKKGLLAQSIQRWHRLHADSTWLLPEVRQIGLSLLQFDVPNINDVVHTLPITIEIALAKFRSGDLLGALQYFTFGESTSPYVRNHWRDQVINHVQLNYCDRFISTIQSIAYETFNPQFRTSLFRLCGFLQSDELINMQYLIWKSSPNKDEYGDYLWGILQSAAARHRAIVEDSLSFFLSLSKVPRDPRYHSRNEVSEFFSTFSNTQWSLSEEQIQLLADIGLTNRPVARIIANVFDGVDSATAVTFAVDFLCNFAEAEPTTEEPRVPVTLGWRLADRSRKITLSDPALSALECIWKDKGKSTPRRKLAFDFWKIRAPKQDVIFKCRKITPDDTALFERSIRIRVSLGDNQAREAIQRDISINKFFWKLEKIWSPDLQSFLLDLLQKEEFFRNRRFREYFWNLLLMIPDVDSSTILTGNWEKLKICWQAIPTALYLSTPATRKLAEEQINTLGFSNWDNLQEEYGRMMHGTFVYAPGSDPLSLEERSNLTLLSQSFQHLHNIYGAFYEDRRDKLTIEQLDSLLPYLPLLHDFSKREFADACIRRGWQDWFINHLYPLLEDEEKKRLWPTDADLVEELKELPTRNIRGQAYSFNEHRIRRGIPTERIITALFRFSETNGSYVGLQVLCHLLEVIGERSHFELIEKYVLTEDIPATTISQLKLNTYYEIRRRSLH